MKLEACLGLVYENKNLLSNTSKILKASPRNKTLIKTRLSRSRQPAINWTEEPLHEKVKSQKSKAKQVNKIRSSLNNEALSMEKGT